MASENPNSRLIALFPRFELLDQPSLPRKTALVLLWRATEAARAALDEIVARSELSEPELWAAGMAAEQLDARAADFAALTEAAVAGDAADPAPPSDAGDGRPALLPAAEVLRFYNELVDSYERDRQRYLAVCSTSQEDPIAHFALGKLSAEHTLLNALRALLVVWSADAAGLLDVTLAGPPHEPPAVGN